MSSGALDTLDGAERREYWAALALRCTKGLSRAMAVRLLRCFGSAYSAVDHVKSWPEAGISPAAAETFLRQEWRREARPEWDAARHLDAQIVLWTDPRYPDLLRRIDDAPILLYAGGDLSLLAGPCVAVVGARACSRAALDFAGRVAAELSAAGVTVVSGLALGVDAAAHSHALGRVGRTIAVLAGGIDVPYPAAHAALYRRIMQQGLAVSEFPPGSRPRRHTFPVRNRVMSGLSLAVLVAEASGVRSGSILTAHIALEQGREVCVPSPEAFPGNYAEGTRSLLMEGATPVANAEEIILAVRPHLKAALARTQGGSAPDVRVQKEMPSNGAASCPAEAAQPARERGGPAALGGGSANPGRKAAAPSVPSGKEFSCSPDESLLLELLSASVLGPDDILCAAQERDASWTAARVSSTLMMLEVRRRIRRTADARYEVCS